MKHVRWGIIGCGDVTEVKSGPAFAKAERSSLVAVMRRDGAKAEDYARRHGVAKWYDDAEALINDPDVDAVYVATPPSSHKEYVLKCAAAGKPVLVEKPMGLTEVECQEMADACADAAVPLYVAFYRRALPRFLKVKALVESGAIGTVRSVVVEQFEPLPDDPKSARGWRVEPKVAGGGLFVDMGVHAVDFLSYLFGDIVSVSGSADNQGGAYLAEDTVTTALRFSSGVQAVGTWCFCAGRAFEQTRIIGDKGEIAFSFFENAPVILRTGQGVESFEIAHPDHVHQPLIQQIVDELTGQGTCIAKAEIGVQAGRVVDTLVGPYLAHQKKDQ